jgi:hypothetical protein
MVQGIICDRDVWHHWCASVVGRDIAAPLIEAVGTTAFATSTPRPLVYQHHPPTPNTYTGSFLYQNGPLSRWLVMLILCQLRAYLPWKSSCLPAPPSLCACGLAATPDVTPLLVSCLPPLQLPRLPARPPPRPPGLSRPPLRPLPTPAAARLLLCSLLLHTTRLRRRCTLPVGLLPRAHAPSGELGRSGIVPVAAHGWCHRCHAAGTVLARDLRVRA